MRSWFAASFSKVQDNFSFFSFYHLCPTSKKSNLWLKRYPRVPTLKPSFKALQFFMTYSLLGKSGQVLPLLQNNDRPKDIKTKHFASWRKGLNKAEEWLFITGGKKLFLVLPNVQETSPISWTAFSFRSPSRCYQSTVCHQTLSSLVFF